MSKEIIRLYTTQWTHVCHSRCRVQLHRMSCKQHDRFYLGSCSHEIVVSGAELSDEDARYFSKLLPIQKEIK